ncbi:MAG: endonuclease VIII [Defluviitaleaceae bacterium]|nr:endonuclease VIII [Defluviitaleaceae bacterium]MCL2836141.1 endonuclease VIII [Defluviitaleaceae bacterium]
MIELPESHVLAKQVAETLTGKTITKAVADASPHKYAWYTGDPAGYNGLLSGRKITGSSADKHYTCGGNTEIHCGDMLLVISTPIRYHSPGNKLPEKHQLLLGFDDSSHITCSVQMWGGMLLTRADDINFPQGFTVNKNPDPLMDSFDLPYFMRLFDGVKKNMSVKAFLATEQRIPGLGNGVLQDILFNARFNPRRRLDTLDTGDVELLHKCVKETIADMAARGGRDTERDLFGTNGGYNTILSSKTLKNPCPVCGGEIRREAFLGGNIYFCPVCQK